ncbi:(S)-benzoin forming benzil reductase [Bacillus sp. BP-3]|uniref:(S)-benzoin forming benzil reductase n=1 Tax=Bacillus sp. BP-3 TaxID=3022773 RepID=UPI002330FD32|nr:(S)-benzoin forming benzil reductase [Bacillus sp. BP-3]MDC2866546.1 (S)-benzoin forming benzil reductase [Bacillus sp. BP-3]
MRYVIVTGTSRGLGEAIALQLLEQGTKLISISRNQNEQLMKQAQHFNNPFDFYSFNLQEIHQIESLMEKIFSTIDVTTVSSIHLINNAGMLAPMKPLERSESEQLIANVHVNLVAPMLLSSAFMKHTKDWNVDKRIINISSGAAQNPYFGWGAYCTTKAGVNMLTKCIALEETDKKYPVKVISFAPGVVDTEMQTEIRQTPKEDFIQVERFLSLKENDHLLSPNYVAKAVIDLLETNHFDQGGIIRIDEQ